MPSLDLDTRVRKAFYVRKRKAGGETFLIFLTTIYAIDEFSETLWELCTEERAIGELVREMTERYTALDPLRCLSLVAHNVVVLLECRMLAIASSD